MQQLFDLFEEIGLPYFRQGSMSDKDYQPAFFTFYNIDTPNMSYYDNKETRFNEYIQVCSFTNDANKVYSLMQDFIKRAKEKGFVIQGRDHDTDAGRPDFLGRRVYIRIINKVED